MTHIFTLVALPRVDADTVLPPWQSAGLQVGDAPVRCYDAVTPDVFYTGERTSHSYGPPESTYVNNYRTGERSLVAPRGFDTCNTRTGSRFLLNADGATAMRFSTREPAGRMVEHFPDYVAPDGSVLYASGAMGRYTGDPTVSPVWDAYTMRSLTPAAAGHLFVSTDDGLTWQERGQRSLA